MRRTQQLTTKVNNMLKLLFEVIINKFKSIEPVVTQEEVTEIKKPVVKKPAVKKPAVKKPVAKKVAAKKPTAKKAK
jgi:hypothetical protein